MVSHMASDLMRKLGVCVCVCVGVCVGVGVGVGVGVCAYVSAAAGHLQG